MNAEQAPAEGATERKRVQDKAGKAAAQKPPLRAVFMGTPEFAATIMQKVAASEHVQILAAYTQPDRPAGRGKKLTPPPVKVLAESLGIPVFQPLNFKNTPEGDAAAEHLAGLKPDVLLVAAYGLILPQRVLNIPSLMPINVHASLLPKYRGAAPIQRSIMAADHITGVTIMRMEAGLDTGPMLMQRAVGIDLNDTSASLHEELAREGAELLLLALERLRAGALASIPQDEARVSHAAKLTKEESRLDLALTPIRLHAAIRGLTPWPGAQLTLEREGEEPLAVQIFPGVFPLSEKMSARCEEKAETAGCGDILGVVENALLVRCGEGCYAVTKLKPAGKQAMDAASFANGYLKNAKSSRLG
ncbi:methionyl-tRNA formyltransferase [Desulfovibrio sp. OttesenSCG-928-G15]|nr:methionyl-tRNA formyltransferase [Desulfovibrio sp. OttesenSCG-928-G15]